MLTTEKSHPCKYNVYSWWTSHRVVLLVIVTESITPLCGALEIEKYSTKCLQDIRLCRPDIK